jgi:hypothetical protein
VYLCFLEMSQNSLSLLHWTFLLIRLYPFNGVLRDRRQSKLESVFQVLPLVHCVPTSITSLFIGFEHMGNEWKVEKVSYEFGIVSFLILYLD